MFRGEALSDWGEDEVYSEQEETRVLRTGQWVYFRRFNGGQSRAGLGDELYDVAADPGETVNLIDAPEHAEVAMSLAARIDDYFARYSRAPADMWRGGQPIQNSMSRAFWREAWGEDWRPVYEYADA